MGGCEAGFLSRAVFSVEGKCREKDAGTKLERLYAAYITMAPPVHTKALGKTTFGKMLNAVFSNIGPHKNRASTVSGIYLLH